MKRAKVKSPDSYESLDEFEVPEGWNLATVEELSETVQYGYTESAIQNSAYPRFLRITDIQDGNVDWDSVPSCEITNEDFMRYELKEGDIVFARTGATTGKSFLIQSCPKAVFASYLIRIRPNKKVDPKFLYLFFQTSDYWRMISENVSGTGQPNCNASKLKKLQLPVPTLAEQENIVARTEALLSQINAARDRLSRVPLIMKKFRQAVLAAACEGRLTEEWREKSPQIKSINISAINLHQKYQKSEFNDQKLSELPEKWQWSKLFETVEIIMGQSPPGISYNQNGEGIPLINGPVEFGPTPFSETIKSKFTTSPTKFCKKKDLVLCVRGSTTGRINIAGFDACIGRGVAALRSKTDQEFLTLFIHSHEDFIYSLGTGSTFPNISSYTIANLDFPLPPLAEQHEIVRRVNALFERADQIEQQVVAATKRTEALTQAVLGKAFAGKL
jgi:type I restriction enzyme S subunit